MREALHVGTPVLTTDQTPWADHSALDGLFIAKPEDPRLQTVLAEARARIDLNWLASDRQKLADWAEARFAWERLAPAYVSAYHRSLSQ